MFLSPQKVCACLFVGFSFHHLQPGPILNLFLHFRNVIGMDSDNLWSLQLGFFSLSVMHVRFILVTACHSSSFIFYSWVIFYWAYVRQFVYPLIGWRTAWLLSKIIILIKVNLSPCVPLLNHIPTPSRQQGLGLLLTLLGSWVLQVPIYRSHQAQKHQEMLR